MNISVTKHGALKSTLGSGSQSGSLLILCKRGLSQTSAQESKKIKKSSELGTSPINPTRSISMPNPQSIKPQHRPLPFQQILQHFGRRIIPPSLSLLVRAHPPSRRRISRISNNSVALRFQSSQQLRVSIQRGLQIPAKKRRWARSQVAVETSGADELAMRCY